MPNIMSIQSGVDPSWKRIEREVDDKAFWLLRSSDDSGSAWEHRVHEFVNKIIAFVRLRDASIDKSTSVDAIKTPSNGAIALTEILMRVCRKSKEVTCVVETNHLDDVHMDLTSGVYALENVVVSKLAVRVSVFVCRLTRELFSDLPGYYRRWESTLQSAQKCRGQGGFLQDHFVGSVVLVPRQGGTIGRTLLDPRWLAMDDVSVRLTDFEQTIRGKSLVVGAWPWRQQDGEVLTCAETTLLGFTCYFSNEFNDYPVTMPTTMLREFERMSDVRVTPSQGRSYNELGRVLTSIGFKPRRYDEMSFMEPLVPGEQVDPLASLLKTARIYVSSGLPVAINAQPPEIGIGHWVTIVGTSDANKANYQDSLEKAERVVGEADGKTLDVLLLHEADLEARGDLVVSDDLSSAYELRSWPQVTGNGMQLPREIVVPMAKDMALGAEAARRQAMRLLRSPDNGMIAHSHGCFAMGQKLVLVQRLVGVRSYLRFRCATCADSLRDFYEKGTFPRFLWLFECLDYEEYRKPYEEREACVELVLDATGQSAADASGRRILFRCPGFIHYRDSSGRGWDCMDDVAATFPAFDLSLRHIRVEPNK